MCVLGALAQQDREVDVSLDHHFGSANSSLDSGCFATLQDANPLDEAQSLMRNSGRRKVSPSSREGDAPPKLSEWDHKSQAEVPPWPLASPAPVAVESLPYDERPVKGAITNPDDIPIPVTEAQKLVMEEDERQKELCGLIPLFWSCSFLWRRRF